MARDPSVSDSEALAREFSEKFSYDALIQSAKDRLVLSDEEFTKLLVEALYANVRSRLDDDQWSDFVNAMGAMQLGRLGLGEWRRFLATFSATFPNTSAFSLAEILVDVLDTSIAPDAIVSFNAEPLLMALINGLLANNIAWPSGTPPHAGLLKTKFDVVTRGISDRKSGRIPFVFCHGLLPVPGTPGTKLSSHSIDKLIFSEGAYLQLANTAFSWQSSMFIDTCLSNTVVFVGLSLTDSNMRRWLAWIQANRLQELQSMGTHDVESTTHYWIEKVPASTTSKRWIESCVAHMGVRLIWINDWKEVGLVFKTLLGL
ncbi:MAG: SIR2 family protein [bacterium]|nr:SIR2 family protein [bacterium]